MILQPVKHSGSIRPAWLLTAGAAVLTTSVVARAAAPQDSGTLQPVSQTATNSAVENEEAFAIRAEATLEKVCSMCHPVEEILRSRRTLREWNDMVIVMVSRGAVGTEGDFTTVKRYLTRYYGVVQVNTATAEELSAVLGLSSKDAAAVVEYRKANGKFANAEALAKVGPSVKSRIEEQPEALRFN